MASILAAPTRWVLTLLSEDIDRDFSRYDAYLDSLPVLYLREGGQKVTQTLQLRPTRQDIGQLSEFEARSDFGDWFTQGDFEGGMGQRFFHRDDRLVNRYLHSEGFDISEHNLLQHLNQTAEADDTNLTDPIGLAEFDSLPFVAQGTSVWRGNGSFPGTWTEEDPQAGEVAEDVLVLTSGGDRLYAALGTNGIHHRTTGGTWDHLADTTPTDVDTGDTRIVRWLKDRLMVVGDAGRSIFEVVVADGVAADAAPTAIETIPSGWTFTEMWEAGPFIFASAINTTSGISRVHAYGLNSGATAIEKKASSPMPKGTLIFSGVGAHGRVFLGGGRQNSVGGLNACLFEAIPNETGELQTLLIHSQDDDDASDLAVFNFQVTEDSIVFGWSRGSDSIYGRFVGLARYNLARNAFSFFLSATASTDQPVNDLLYFRGRFLLAVNNTGLFYEDLGVPVSSAFLVSSVADWHTTAQKAWDLFEVTHHALPTGCSVDLDYTKKNPDEEDWQDALVSSTPGSTGAEVRIEDVSSRLLAVKLTSSATATDAPEILAFAVRSVPAPQDTEWRLVRTLRVMDEDRKDARAEVVHQDPRAMRAQLQDLAHEWVTVYEPGITWIAYVEDVVEVEPANAAVAETGGTSEREAYYVELRMVARRAA